ncbi:MAG: hypothetical protein JGK24_32870 [Microcoleus sp. PH2017_29_MFU_D_A]|uniref:hypothetical protein n=1 Tax=unclassified Microcoleus TaxID=2642155 RepID=UPI001DC8CB4A|nr:MULTISPECIES: hypothetical protein [unclassified Microcoleus]MCC3422235.1 hypothetical protein [Microcoleus sp. PH2017_07_MST_O_A]MCC3513834.1 hypothetical protein [Microcoleus sp. PH2017_17_BER_D_A]MCC3428457.1 hypothetical protein [Microcoleus sp. PH2017_01_SCD_O_A]MCC3458045.1 hypothetical protein [Microcoleus sp. PH2017_08_TRC_O_A]MCC3476448.1 hypothetical protein [Microcoleus sp. PH2017_13_LAR_U_A]
MEEINDAFQLIRTAFTTEELDEDMANWHTIKNLNAAASEFLSGNVNGSGFFEMAEPFLPDTRFTIDEYIEEIEQNLINIGFLF